VTFLREPPARRWRADPRRQELLGHFDVRLTLSSYAHVLDENRTKMSGTIDRVFDSQSDSQAGRRQQE
jgi:hypothetical protein